MAVLAQRLPRSIYWYSISQIRKKLTFVSERLQSMGYPQVEPENGYWKELGVTIEDPDGWRIVLMNRSYV